MPEAMKFQLELIAQQNKRSMNKEIQIAIQNHINDHASKLKKGGSRV